MQTAAFEKSFRHLVESWENHEGAARSGSIAALAASRLVLDAARLEAAQARRLSRAN